MAWTAYVDYVRLTYPAMHDVRDVWERYRHVPLVVGRRNGELEENAEAWRWMGYQGVKLGSVMAGAREDGIIVQASGALAADVVDLRLPWKGVPRIDLQVTYWYDRHWAGVAADVAARSVAARAGQKGRPWKVAHINGTGSGDTCYIGARGGETKFLRCYDKWLQSDRSEQWRHAWRYECELTDGHGRYALGTIEDVGQSETTIAGMVASYWRERGVRLPEVSGSECYSASRISREPTTEERRLAWLERQVRPSIDKLLASGVSSERVRQALGL